MLLLFDIDGTLLLKAAEDHAAALRAAIERVHGVRGTRDVPVETAGRTDPSIAREICLKLGISAERFDDRLPALKRAAVEEYARRCRPDLSATVAPGVPDLLDDLAARDDMTLSLVTGNLRGIAHIKLERAGIGRYFSHDQGGFGSDDEDRSELPAIARARAGGVPPSEAVVIGDTPLDIACARADGVRCIAVATGRYTAEELSGADAVARSAREIAALL